MVVARSEAGVVAHPVFPDLKPSVPLDVRRRMVLEQFGPLIGQTKPYGSPDFGIESPIGEDARRELVRGMASLHGSEGYKLFRASGNLRQISDDAATHRALETMYTGPMSEDTEEGYLWARLFIENIHNSMAVRNRLRIVKSEFEAYMREVLKRKPKEIDVLSIAAGSSRGIMEVLAELNGQGHDGVHLQMVDHNQEALDDGKRLVSEFGITESVEFTRATFANYRRYLPEGYEPDFIEIVGLLDYVPAEKVENLLAAVRERLADGGVVLFSNIAPNYEQDFTHKVVGWPDMYYRNAKVLRDFAGTAGFGASKIRVIREPLGIYNLVLATK